MNKFLALFCILSASLSFGQGKDVTEFTLSPKGFITAWLMKGPFTVTEGVLRDRDFLEPEGGELKNFIMDELYGKISKNGMDNLNWFPLYSDKYIISFLDYFKITNKTAAYGLCFIESNENKKVLIRLGSDDGVKLFLNGKLIHNNANYRSVSIDEDAVITELNKGMNALLIKIDQGSGGWGFCLRINNESGEQVKNVSIKIPYKFSYDEILSSALSSFDINTVLDKTLPDPRLIVFISTESSIPKNLNEQLKVKLQFLNSSSELLEEFHKSDIPSLSQFTGMEVVFKPKNIQPGQYILRLIILDRSDKELLSRENIVFWN